MTSATISKPNARKSRIPLGAWAESGQTFIYRGHPVFFRAEGPTGGEPLVLIHGFPTASWDWEGVWPSLAQRFRVYALDMIGFGLSAKPSDYAYSLLDQADLFEAFLRHEGVTSYHVLAHDYGDTVAQELLARSLESGERPTLLSVALLNGGLFPETHRPVFTQRLLLSPLGPLVAKLASRAQLAANMKRIFGPDTPPDDALIDDFWSLLTRHNGRTVMSKLIRYMVERRQYRTRWVGALQNARIPLKVIDGGADPISGAHMVFRYKELVPHADVTLLERIGHYPQVEAPGLVLDAYMEFRDRVATNPDDRSPPSKSTG